MFCWRGCSSNERARHEAHALRASTPKVYICAAQVRRMPCHEIRWPRRESMCTHISARPRQGIDAEVYLACVAAVPCDAAQYRALMEAPREPPPLPESEDGY